MIDFWLTGIWLRRGTFVGLRWTGRWPFEWAGGREWRNCVFPDPLNFCVLESPSSHGSGPHSAWLGKNCGKPGRTWQSACWRHPVLLIPPVLDPQRRLVGNLSPWVFGMAIPLLMGVGAYRADQKGRDASWAIGPSRRTARDREARCVDGADIPDLRLCIYVERIGWQLSKVRFGLQDSILFGIGSRLPGPSSCTALSRSSASDWVGRRRALHRAGLCDRPTHEFSRFQRPAGLGSAMGATVFACQVWAIFGTRGVPLWWTIGTIPAALFRRPASVRGVVGAEEAACRTSGL